MLNGHIVVLHIDALAIGHVGFFVGVHQVACPAFGVDIGLGFNVFPKFARIFLVFFQMNSIGDFGLASKFVGMGFAVAGHRTQALCYGAKCKSCGCDGG